MRRILPFVFAILVSAAGAFAQAPVIGSDGVLAVATNIPSGLPNSGLAQGSFFVIYGSNLGPSAIVFNTNTTYQTNVGGTSVSFTVGGTTVPALMYYSSANQISGILPSNTPAGNGTVTVTFNGQTSATAPVKIVTSNFGIFTLNQAGTGPAVATDGITNVPNTLRHTAKPGDILVLWGSGLAPIDPSTEGIYPLVQQDLRGIDNLNVHVYVGGKDAAIDYAGRTQFPGLDQINFHVPADLSGCYVPVAVSVNGVVSNHSSISIDANGATCTDPFGLTQAQTQTASTGTLSVGSLLMTRLSVDVGLGVPITEDTAEAKFYKFEGGTSPALGPEYAPSFIGLASFGSCNVTTCHGTTCVPTSNGIAALAKLDAGTALVASKSDGSAKTNVTKQANGFYTGDLGSAPLQVKDNNGNLFPAANYLVPGSFLMTGSGGADVQAFSAPITVPGLLNWTNESQIFGGSSPSLDRTKDLTITWTGGSATDYVTISASSATCAGTVPAASACDATHTPAGSFYVSATVTCQEKASAGTFTIPSWVLSALPASNNVNFGGITQAGGAALVGLYNVSNTFTSNLDVSLANSIVLNGKNVNVQ